MFKVNKTAYLHITTEELCSLPQVLCVCSVYRWGKGGKQAADQTTVRQGRGDSKRF